MAVEAVPHTAWLARYNLYLNNVTEVPCNMLSRGGGPGATRGVACVLNNAVTRSGGGSVSISFSLNKTQSASLGAGAESQGNAVEVPTVTPQQLVAYRHMDGRNLPVLLFKMDCEGCEFEALPAMGSIFADRRKIRSFAGEVHMSVAYGETKPTFAAKRSKQETEDLLAQLRTRGCIIPAKGKTSGINC